MTSTTVRAPLRVLWVNHRDPSHSKAGGAESYIWEILTRLESPRFEHVLLCEREPGLPIEESIGNITVKRRGNSITLHLRALLWKEEYDVCVESVAHAVPFFIPAGPSRTKVVVLYHLHGDILKSELSPLSARLVSRLERLVRYEDARFVAISESTRDSAVQILGIREPILVISPGVSVYEFAPCPKMRPPTFLYLGWLKAYKRVDHAISAFKALRGDFRLVIAGDGYDRQRLQNLCKDDPRISFVGRVSPERKRQLLAEATATLLTSAREGYSLPTLESAASGTPTVGYRIGPLPEVIEDGVTGRLVEDGNIDGLTQAMRDALNHPEWSRNAREFAMRHTWERTSEKFRRLLLQAAKPEMG